MSYQRKRLALSGSRGPDWYRAMGGVSSQPRDLRVSRRYGPALGSLGDDAPPGTTLSNPTVVDPTANAQWQASVLAQLQAGVNTLKTAELQKWLQVIATVSIPLSAAIWRMIFRRGADPTV